MINLCSLAHDLPPQRVISENTWPESESTRECFYYNCFWAHRRPPADWRLQGFWFFFQLQMISVCFLKDLHPEPSARKSWDIKTEPRVSSWSPNSEILKKRSWEILWGFKLFFAVKTSCFFPFCIIVFNYAFILYIFKVDNYLSKPFNMYNKSAESNESYWTCFTGCKKKSANDADLLKKSLMNPSVRFR